MPNQAVQEAIRIVLETQGREGVDALRSALGGLGDVSAETVRDTNKLLDSLADLGAQAAQAAEFDRLRSELARTGEELDAASKAAYHLALQMGSMDKPSKELQERQAAARKEVDRLQRAFDAQSATLGKVEQQLSATGADTRDLGDLQARLRSEIGRTAAAIERQGQAITSEASAMAQLRQRIADGDEAFRRMALSGRASADALRSYRDRVAGADEGTRRLSEAARGTSGVFVRLRSVMAGALAFLGFNSAVEGVKNLFNVASAAENARRALANLYGSQAAGNRVYADLRTLAAENGLAFETVYQSALKLKAFGLDPLNGSLQALVDQNASVGGSQQDLEGKVLALGQAWAKQKLQGEEILQLVERGVPVWELLQRATGKNVAQLQKLSEQGKLGRDVIQALYQEIGQVNAGSAQRGLSGLSGLLGQVTARWQEFLGKVADSGVTEFFRRQLQSLLGSTGNLDDLARRVGAAIVSTLEAIRSLGQQLAPLVSIVGNVGLALARNADALLVLAKAYAAVRVVDFYNNLARGLITLRASAAATDALAASAASTGGALGRLGGAVSAVPRLLKISVAAIGIDYVIGQLIELNRVRNDYLEALAKQQVAEAGVRALYQDAARQGQELQRIYAAYADTVVQSAGQIQAKTRDQAEAYRLSLESAQKYYKGIVKEAAATGQSIDPEIRAALRRIDGALEQTQGRLRALAEEAQKQAALAAFVNQAVAKFDELASKGKAAKEAVSGIFAGVDFGTAKGVDNAVSILEQISVRGRSAAKAIRAELREALQAVSSEDLPRVQAAAKSAFAEGSDAARAFAAEVNRINLTRLGVDVEAIETGFTKAGRSAVDAFRGAVGEIDRLGLDVQKRSQAVAQAFDSAFKQASTKKELAALKQELQRALSEGIIGFAEFKQRIAETDARIAELSNTGRQLGQDLATGASQAADALSQVSEAAGSVAEETQRAADGVDTATAYMGAASKEGQQFAATLFGVSEEANRAYMALNRYAGSQQFVSKFNRVTQAVDEQGRALLAEVEALNKANAAYDESAQRREELRAQFNFLADSELDKLIDAERRLQQTKQQAADREAKQREVATRQRQDQVKSETEQLEKQRQAALELERARSQTAAPTDRAPAVAATTGALPIEILLKSEVSPGQRGLAMPLSQNDLSRLAQALLPVLLSELERRRSSSR